MVLITSMSTGAFAERSFRPICSCKAVNRETPISLVFGVTSPFGEADGRNSPGAGTHSREPSKVPGRFVLSITTRFTNLDSVDARRGIATDRRVSRPGPAPNRIPHELLGSAEPATQAVADCRSRC